MPHMSHKLESFALSFAAPVAHWEADYLYVVAKKINSKQKLKHENHQQQAMNGQIHSDIEETLKQSIHLIRPHMWWYRCSNHSESFT